jgi:hypothetical protein
MENSQAMADDIQSVPFQPEPQDSVAHSDQSLPPIDLDAGHEETVEKKKEFVRLPRELWIQRMSPALEEVAKGLDLEKMTLFRAFASTTRNSQDSELVKVLRGGAREYVETVAGEDLSYVIDFFSSFYDPNKAPTRQTVLENLQEIGQSFKKLRLLILRRNWRKSTGFVHCSCIGAPYRLDGQRLCKMGWRHV